MEKGYPSWRFLKGGSTVTNTTSQTIPYREAAKKIGVSKTTAYGWIRDGYMSSINHKGKLYVTEQEVDRVAELLKTEKGKQTYAILNAKGHSSRYSSSDSLCESSGVDTANVGVSA